MAPRAGGPVDLTASAGLIAGRTANGTTDAKANIIDPSANVADGDGSSTGAD